MNQVDIYNLQTPIFCKLLSCSENSSGDIIYSFEWYLPKFMLAEVNKHRALTGSTSSDRAIPTKYLIEEYEEAGFFEPIYYGKNKAGMSSHEELSGWNKLWAKFWWKCATKAACFFTKRLAATGLHKQWTNRILMPFIYCHHVTTGTDWENFLWLRDDADSVQPEFAVLARMVRKEIEKAKPRQLSNVITNTSGWHYAYITEEEREKHFTNPRFLAMVDAARCARASYAKQGIGFNGYDRDIETYHKLIGDGTKPHFTCMEHACHSYPQGRNKNFRGFRQFRSLLEKEFKYIIK